MIIIKINYASTLPNVNITYDNSVIYAKVVYGNGGGGTATWGLINGTLSDQTDLQNALDAKVPYSGATANVNLGEYEMKAGQMTLDTSPTGTAAVGTTRWNDTIGSSETTLKGGSVILKNGVDLVARVVNKVSPNTTLTKASYQAVRISGAQGQRLAVELAQANNDNNSADTIGLVTETISPNQEGFIMTVGSLESINTTGSLQGETWTDGDVLYLSPTTPGVITNVKPIAPQHLVVIGYVEYAHQNNGKIYVKVMNGWELGELHDVNTTGATNGQVLSYNSTSGIWEPTTNGSGTVTSVAVSGGTGISVSGSPITSSGTITVTNSAPDQVVNLTGAGTTTTSGTYPNFTITSNDQFVGTVTSVGLTSATSGVTIGSSPITTSGNISLSIATASGSQNGLLSSTDWTTFNNKQNALTNPITGTGTSGQVAYWSGTNTQTGSNNLFWDNANGRLGIGTNSPTKVLTINTSTTNDDGLLLRSSTGATLFSVTKDGVSNNGAEMFFYVGGTIKFALRSNSNFSYLNGGNFGFGTTTDSGQRLQVTGDTLLKGSGNTNATTALTVQNSDGANILRIINNGRLAIGSANTNQITASDSNNDNINTGTNLSILYASNSTAGFGLFIKSANTNERTYTSGVGGAVSVNDGFAPTSGTGTFTAYRFNAIINQTGGANGITRGLYIQPTLTAAADWRSIEWSNNSGWGLYGAGTANNYMAGSLGIGSTTLTGINLRLSKTITGATSSYGILNDGVIQPDVTSIAAYNRVVMSKAAGVATSIVVGYWAVQGTYSGTVDTQYGYLVDSTLTGATNNYAYFSNIASGTGRWNLYMNGTALNYLNGSLLIGSTTDSGEKLQVTGTMKVTGAVEIGGNLTLLDADNIIFGTTTGTKIGTATSQKLAFWNATPIVQPTTAIAEATFVENSGGTSINVDSTFAGYTLQQIAQALKDMGILA